MFSILNKFNLRMKRYISAFIITLILGVGSVYGSVLQSYNINGVVIDSRSREPIAFATIAIFGTNRFTTSDSNGSFVFTNVTPGVYRLTASLLGYNQYISQEYMLSASGLFVRIELEQTSFLLDGVTVRPKVNPFVRSPETPLSQRNLGVQEIERNPGSNRDISRVVSSLPGVSGVFTGGYRNDIIVRGGGPSENKFYFDGIEIPTINHFSTQGASGGPVGIVDADLIREVNFYSGTFPVNRSSALSSILDIRVKDGDPLNRSYKFTVGASEAGISSSGYIDDKTTYIFSARRSYLQFLFKVLDLPFLPTYTDFQFKIKRDLGNRRELTLLGIAGVDRMELNESAGVDDPTNEYILSYLPTIEQEVFTVGAVYRYFYSNNTLSLFLSHSYLNNRNTKFLNNDNSISSNLSLRFRSVEQKSNFRVENLNRISNFRLIYGLALSVPDYTNSTFKRVFLNNPIDINYNSNLTLFTYALFFNSNYRTSDQKLSVNMGMRLDANNFSSSMSNPFNQFSPRFSLSYELFDDFNLNLSAGRYYQLPPLTALGYKRGNQFINKGLKYSGSDQYALGFDYSSINDMKFGVELFYKNNFNGLFSINDSIPLDAKAVEYGAIGDEVISSDLKGRSYGAELYYRWFSSDKFNLISSVTIFRSEFKNSKDLWTPTQWDNRFLLTLSGGYRFGKNYIVGAKFRYAGGAPFTPIDEDKSSLVLAWDASGREYRDFSQYNSKRLGDYKQLDLRVDREFFFKNFAFKLYLDIQNVLNFKYRDDDALMSTGIIVNPNSPIEDQRYQMRRIELESGTILPTIGITFEF